MKIWIMLAVTRDQYHGLYHLHRGPECVAPYRDGTTYIVMSPLEFMQRLATLVPVRGCI